MTLEEALFSLLTSLPLITDLVATRVYPLKLPQNPTYPAIVYQQASGEWTMAHDGPGDMGFPRFQFDCYGTSFGSTKVLTKTLRQNINGYKGTVGDIEIGGIFFLNEVDDFGSQAEIYRVAVDFRIIYKGEHSVIREEIG